MQWQCCRGCKRAKEDSTTLDSNVQVSRKWSRKQDLEQQTGWEFSHIKDIVHTTTALRRAKQKMSNN